MLVVSGYYYNHRETTRNKPDLLVPLMVVFVVVGVVVLEVAAGAMHSLPDDSVNIPLVGALAVTQAPQSVCAKERAP